MLELCLLFLFTEIVCFQGKSVHYKEKNTTPSTSECRNTTTFWPKPKICQLEMLPGYQRKGSLKPQWVWALPPVRRYLPWNTTFWGPLGFFISTLQGDWLKHFDIYNFYISTRMKTCLTRKAMPFSLQNAPTLSVNGRRAAWSQCHILRYSELL